MLTHEELAGLLYALVTGYPERAVRLAYEADSLSDERRSRLMLQLAEGVPPSAGAEGLGDVLREWGAPRDLVNECYRAAFYASEESGRLSANALFAQFLANKGGLVLDKWPHYFGIYDRYLSRFRGGPVRVLEVGVYRGGGLDLLRAYLGPGAYLVGVDIDPVAVEAASRRHAVELGDQTDAAFLRSVVERHGPFDVVIDDGGHTMEQQITTATELLPVMPSGSVYIVEDTHTSYWPEYGGGPHAGGTFTEWVKGLVDDVHAYHWSSTTPPSRWSGIIDAVHVHDSVTVLDIGRSFAPFSEVVGTWDFLKLSRPLSAVHSELLATRDLAVAERDAANTKSVEAQREAEQAQREAEQAQREAASAEQERVRAELAQRQAWEQLDSVRSSRSWRLTAPLRRLAGLRDR